MAEELELFGKPEEQLVVVNEAIYAVLRGGQSYRIGTRSLTRADLTLLWDMPVSYTHLHVYKRQHIKGERL